MHIDGVREGDLIAYPGPPRRQALADFFGVGLAHIGVAVRTADTLSVVEIDFKGIRTRSLRAIVRHYPKVEALRLPICDHESKRIAQRALEGLGDKRPYAHNLARFGFVWANLRSIQHPHVEYWSRALFPFAAAIAWVFGRGKVTCSGFVYEALTDTGLATRLPLRFDRALPESSLGPSRRDHTGWRSYLCGPADISCVIPANSRFVIQQNSRAGADLFQVSAAS